jgi:2-C-methyl-D-erythritol 2,4-cyclodiphosphate synthase
MSPRVGSGFDAHRLEPGLPLFLGGVLVPCDRGLAGHSDGDCLIHAICDALLGAAAAGDLGALFPSSDPRFKGAASRLFLEAAAGVVRERGYSIGNVDATVIAQAPSLAPHLLAMRKNLAAILGIPEQDVSVKAKSTDQLGATGRGEGIAALASVLLMGGRT